MAKAAGNDEERQDAQRRINQLSAKYASFSKASGLPTRAERLNVKGFKSVKISEKPFTNGKNGGIIKLNRALQRKNTNIGAFSDLEIPMQKRKVKELAQKYGIDISGLKIKIQRDESFLYSEYLGVTDDKNMGRIDLFPLAFVDEEQLIKTLIHEKCHVEQFRKYGSEYVAAHAEEMEKEARAIEKSWRDNLRGVKNEMAK